MSDAVVGSDGRWLGGVRRRVAGLIVLLVLALAGVWLVHDVATATPWVLRAAAAPSSTIGAHPER